MTWTTPLAILGLVIFAIGFGIGARSTADGLGGLARAMFLARGLRLAIVGLCTFAVALGTAYGSSATVGVALVILGEEMLEIATVIVALHRGEPGIGRGAPVLSTKLSVRL